jgi:3-polyprenyl-4-hydroxybenzoate decarboxylase
VYKHVSSCALTVAGEVILPCVENELCLLLQGSVDALLLRLFDITLPFLFACVI